MQAGTSAHAPLAHSDAFCRLPILSPAADFTLFNGPLPSSATPSCLYIPYQRHPWQILFLWPPREKFEKKVLKILPLIVNYFFNWYGVPIRIIWYPRLSFARYCENMHNYD